ncbi:MAG TPA: aspartate dehydrogenase domain-containing protein [bacterium]|nr:aspartate dehydrogenase domain-containing protein [bacterium]
MTPQIRVGLIGCGAIGRFLIQRFHDSPSIQIERCWDAMPPARERLSGMWPSLEPKIATPEAWHPAGLTHLIEAAHPTAVIEALEYCMAYGWHATLASVGGLLTPEGDAVLRKALAAGVEVQVPSGAIGGLDILRAIPKEELAAVTLRTIKHPRSLPPAEAAGITEATMLFGGTAREAIARFPKNINVAATLSLAGLGPDRTWVELWADPSVGGNTHRITIESLIGTYEIACTNQPFEENPATSKLAALSITAALEGQAGGLRVGS